MVSESCCHDIMCGLASAPVALVQFTITPAFNQVKQLVHYDEKLWLFSETAKHTVQPT